MDLKLKDLCLKLHSNRVKECRDYLDAEIAEVSENETEQLLLAVINGVKTNNKASSTLTYCLGISDQKPHGPLTITDGSLPDIDVDFENRKRKEIIDYVVQRYGDECVSGIGTFGYKKAKSVIKDTARTLGYPIELGEKITKALLDPIAGKPQSLEVSIQEVPQVREWAEGDGPEAEVIKWSLRLEDTIKSIGRHAGGICIANEPVWETTPTYNDKDGFPVTQWEMNGVEDAGLVKFDFLGVKALDKISICRELVKERHDIDLDVYNLPLDDEKVFELLRSGNITTLFQLEASGGIKDMLIQIQPECFGDVSAAIALYRPGPLHSGYCDKFINSKNGTYPIIPPVEQMVPILEETYGILVYQEQLMRIVVDCCGFSLADADILRKGVGKKKLEVLQSLEKQFIDGWVKCGHPRQEGNNLWSDILNFADYSFNKAHSVGYALITYATAYLKAHYPIEWMCSVMIVDQDDRDQMVKIMAECSKMGIGILPPDINKSGNDFSIDGEDILFGLGAVKNVGNSAKVVIERRGKPYKSLRNFCDRMRNSQVNKGRVESLIKAGAMREFGPRALLLQQLSQFYDLEAERKKYESKLATYERKMAKYNARLQEIKEGSDKKPLKLPPKPDEPVDNAAVYAKPLTDDEIRGFEKNLLGCWITSHPLDPYINAGKMAAYCPVSSLESLPNKEKVCTLGVVAVVQEITTKKKKKMAFLTLEDKETPIEVVLFPKTMEKYAHLTKEGLVLEVFGNVDCTEVENTKLTKLIAQKVRLADPVKVSKKAKPVLLEGAIEALPGIIEVINVNRGPHKPVEMLLSTQSGQSIKLKLKTQIKDVVINTKF